MCEQSLSMPIACVECLAELVARSNSSTTTELLTLLEDAHDQLVHASFNPISLSCGASLFVSIVLSPPLFPPFFTFPVFRADGLGGR